MFPESGELVINDFTREGNDDLIVVDVSTNFARISWIREFISSSVASWLRVSDSSALGEPAHLPIDCGERGRALECLTLEHELDRSRVNVSDRGAGDGL